MLISKAIHIENENVNLEKGALETATTQSACLRASWVVGSHALKEDGDTDDRTNKGRDA